MKLTARSTLTDVAFVVCTALSRRGFVGVLTGGSAATFHVWAQRENQARQFEAYEQRFGGAR